MRWGLDMSIEAMFVSHDTGEVYHLKTVLPGRTWSCLDLSYSQKKIVTTHCLPTDQGANIYVVDARDITASPDKSVGSLALPDEQYLVETLQPGFPYQREILDFEREWGHLILQHVAPNGLIQSNN